MKRPPTLVLDTAYVELSILYRLSVCCVMRKRKNLVGQKPASCIHGQALTKLAKKSRVSSDICSERS